MTEPDPNDADSEPFDPDGYRVTVYTDAVTAYLDEATWLTLVDAPFKVHAQQIAKSLDRQLTRDGEVQSALASTFQRLLASLDKRRPAPSPDPLAGQISGQTDLLSPEFGG